MTDSPDKGQGSTGAPAISLDTANLSILNGLLSSSCGELLADYGLQFGRESPSQAAALSTVLMATIGFSGRDLRGTLALRASGSVLQATYTAGGGGDDSGFEPADWSCELVNQLLGRLKNKLRAYDVSFAVDLPHVLGALPVGEPVMHGRIVCDRGMLAAYLEVSFTPGFVFQDAGDESLPSEGEYVCFELSDGE